jgi:hypothetical protein
MAGAIFPEGWVLLAILFIFPYLLARKNKFNAEEIIHAYMEDTEKRLIAIMDKFYAVRSSHAKAYDTYRKTCLYHLEKLHYNVFYKPHHILGSVLYMVVKRLSHNR